jgi:hypothetical protein
MVTLEAGSVLQSAQRLAELGFYVFPCRRGSKEPAVPWSTEATRTREQIAIWWQHEPEWNLAVACGPSKLVVIDLDGQDGVDSWNRIADEYPDFPETGMVRTGSGGIHLWFNRGDNDRIRNSVRRVASGIDVRGQGGYVIVPPSLHASGRAYTWECSPAAVIAMPAWLTELILASTPSGLAPKRDQQSVRGAGGQQQRPGSSGAAALRRGVAVLRRAPPGERNETLFLTALAVGRYVAIGRLDQVVVTRELTEAARFAGLEEAETLSTIASGFRAAGSLRS